METKTVYVQLISIVGQRQVVNPLMARWSRYNIIW